jgi:hypothetical protein
MSALVAAAALTPTATHAAPDVTSIEETLAGLRKDAIHLDERVANFVERRRLVYATAVASRAADGAAIKFAFVDVPDDELDAFRDAVFAALDLGERGAVVIATPVSVTMRTKTLHPGAEAAIIERDAGPVARLPRRYTEPLAELVYDVGLVIHNSTPGATPRGSGPDADLRTFTGSFPGESDSRERWPPIVLAAAVAAALTVAVAWRRLSRTVRAGHPATGRPD